MTMLVSKMTVCAGWPKRRRARRCRALTSWSVVARSALAGRSDCRL